MVAILPPAMPFDCKDAKPIQTLTLIWGGPDTQTEHFFNRLPAWFLKRLGWGGPQSTGS